MTNANGSRRRAAAALVGLALLAVALGSAVVAGTPSRPATPTTCVLEVSAPRQAIVVIDGRHFGQHRRFTYSRLTPGRKYRTRIEVRQDQQRDEQTLAIEAGRNYRVKALGGPNAAPPASAYDESAQGEAAQDEPADDLTGAGRGVTAMGLGLYRRLAEKPGNIVISPLSLESVLAMTAGGARGQTLEQMDRVLHLLGGGLGQVSLGALLTELEKFEPAPVADSGAGSLAGNGAPPTQLQLANGLWIQQGDPLVAEFLALVRHNYGAHLQEVDFGESAKVRQAVNDWCAEQTHDKIREILEPGKPSPDARLLLTSAIYFRGAWANPFDSRDTSPATFHTRGGEVTVPTMNLRARLRHYRGENLQMLELPYADKRLAMLVILPDASTDLATFEASLSDENLSQWTRGLVAANVSASLPKFQIDWAGSLKQTFIALGMSDAFGQAADLRGISQRHDLLIADIAHRAWIAVDEQGSEAAGAAAVTMAPKSMPGAPVEFRADRPFVFLIYDTARDATLFAGRLADPRTG